MFNFGKSHLSKNSAGIINLVLSEISSEAEDISRASRSEEENTFTTEYPNEEIRSSTTERPGASGWDEKIQVRASTSLTTKKSGLLG